MMNILSNEVRAEMARKKLQNSRMLATGLLVLAFVLFVLASLWIKHYPGLGYLKAFAEAAMVGALADWFAVTALFRHPLGLPIPHTAILPKNQLRIAEELGRFIEHNFIQGLRDCGCAHGHPAHDDRSGLDRFACPHTQHQHQRPGWSGL